MGYFEFCRLWNGGTSPCDTQRLSNLYLADNPKNNEAEPSDNPPLLANFYITAAQVGLATSDSSRSTDATMNHIVHEYTTLMAARQRKQQESVEERCQQRVRAFNQGKLTTSRVFNHSSHKHRPKKHARKSMLDRKTTPIPSDDDLPLETPQTPTAAITPTHPTNPSTLMDTNN